MTSANKIINTKLTVLFSSLCPGITQTLNELLVLSKIYGLDLFHINADCLPHGVCYNDCARTCIPTPSCNPMIHLDLQSRIGRKRITFRDADTLGAYLKAYYK